MGRPRRLGEPPFEVMEPARSGDADRVQFAPFGLAISPPFPGGLAAGRADAAPFRGRFRRRTGRPLRRDRRAAAAGRIFPAPISTSIASPTSSTRRCSRAGCRTSRTPARCASPPGSARFRASSARPSRSIADRFRSRRVWRAIAALHRPYHACLCRARRARARAIRLCDPHRLPFHAVDVGRCRGLRHRSRRPIRLQRGRLDRRYAGAALRDRGLIVRRNKPYAGGYITEHYGAPSYGAATPCRLKSIGRSIWTSGRSENWKRPRRWPRRCLKMARALAGARRAWQGTRLAAE